jgi:hypothetical protein
MEHITCNNLPNVLRVFRRNYLRWARYEECLRKEAQCIKYWSRNITRETVVLWKITRQVFSYVMFRIRFNRIFIDYHDAILEPTN